MSHSPLQFHLHIVLVTQFTLSFDCIVLQLSHLHYAQWAHGQSTVELGCKGLQNEVILRVLCPPNY
jgi:hypothetical protein